MRILALLHDYLPEHVGGVEVHAHRVGRELARPATVGEVVDRLERLYSGSE